MSINCRFYSNLKTFEFPAAEKWHGMSTVFTAHHSETVLVILNSIADKQTSIIRDTNFSAAVGKKNVSLRINVLNRPVLVESGSVPVFRQTSEGF